MNNFFKPYRKTYKYYLLIQTNINDLFDYKQNDLFNYKQKVREFCKSYLTYDSFSLTDGNTKIALSYCDIVLFVEKDNEKDKFERPMNDSCSKIKENYIDCNFLRDFNLYDINKEEFYIKMVDTLNPIINKVLELENERLKNYESEED